MTDLRPPIPSVPADPPWRIVIPVKDARYGKSRLARATEAEPSARVELNRAVAADTIAAAVAALGAPFVLVVTSDAVLAAASTELGIEVVSDPGSGLNGALKAGLRRTPGPARAALLGDLPCLTPGDLLDALSVARHHRQSFVPDAQGVGTVLRCSTAASAFVPRFGPASADRHARDGAARLELNLPRLRTDVDDLGSLAAARRLGLGERTRTVLARLGSGWISQMQASVHSFDPDKHTGSVLRDDGVEVRFGVDAFEASGLRLLRAGQRVTVEVRDDEVVALGIIGIGGPIR